MGGAEDLRIRTSVDDPVRWVWPLIDYPENEGSTARLLLADELVARWFVGDIPEEIVIEELHTVVEAALRRRLNAKQRQKWPTLLNTAETDGLLSGRDRSLFERFNQHYRNRLKHRGEILSDCDRRTVHTLLREVLAVLEGLVAP